MPTTVKEDNRPRFGICYSLDSDPQTIFERQRDKLLNRKNRRTVAVIPLPFMSAKVKAKVRAFAKTLCP